MSETRDNSIFVYGPHCCRCNKEIKGGNRARAIYPLKVLPTTRAADKSGL